MQIITNAEAVGRYQALPEADIFAMEYWSLEQAKLGKQPPQALSSQIVYITGAGQGIGAATARLFAQAGAHLYLVDRCPETLASLAQELSCPYEVVDVTNAKAVSASFEHVCRTLWRPRRSDFQCGNRPPSAHPRMSPRCVAKQHAGKPARSSMGSLLCDNSIFYDKIWAVFCCLMPLKQHSIQEQGLAPMRSPSPP